MTIDEIQMLNDRIGREDKKILEKVVSILDDLKEIDIDRLDRMMALTQLAKPLFPKELMPGIVAFESDITLIKFFSEQAKKYDHDVGALESAKALFGKEIVDGLTKTS